MNNMFGTPEIPVRRVDFETEIHLMFLNMPTIRHFRAIFRKMIILEIIRNRYTMELPRMSQLVVSLHKRKTDFFVMIAEQRSTKEFMNTL